MVNRVSNDGYDGFDCVILVAQIDASHPVDGLDVILHRGDELVPIGFDFVVDIPAVGGCLVHSLAKERCLMHELLWYAADVDTGAADAPLGAQRSWLHKVQAGDACAMRHSLLGAGQATRAASNNNQIIIVVSCK